ncbi:MAG: hypothetical protein ACK559_28695, partial [bacterium]
MGRATGFALRTASGREDGHRGGVRVSLTPRRGTSMTTLRRRSLRFLDALLLLPWVAVLARKAPPVASSRYDAVPVDVRFGGAPGRITAALEN